MKLATLLFLVGMPAFGLDGTIVTDYVPSAARIVVYPGSAPLQGDTTRVTTQAVVGDSTTLPGGIRISGTAWTLLDSLPTNNPQQVPDSGVSFSSRLLQLYALWPIVPGGFILEVGKQIIHPSSGFFKTPLNLLSRGATGNVPQSTPAASPQWEEGWVGAKLVGIVGDWTLENLLSPEMTWNDEANKTLQYISLQQPDWQDQIRLDAHLDPIDLQVLTLVTGSDLGTSQPVFHDQSGVGLDTNWGDNLTLHAEATLADALDRLEVADVSNLTVVQQTQNWVWRALVGGTWSINSDLSFLTEYFYNGQGFFGNAYTTALQYAKSRGVSSTNAPDIVGQFGSFSLGKNYSFFRLSDNISDQITTQGWAEVNLQDLSGMMGIGIAAKYDSWGLSGAFTQVWGSDGTEGQVLPFLWQLDAELQLFF